MRIENLFTHDEVAIAEAIRSRLTMLVRSARKYIDVTYDGGETVLKARTFITEKAEDALYYAELLERTLASAATVSQKMRHLATRKYRGLPANTTIRRWERTEDGDLEEVSLEQAAAIRGVSVDSYLKTEQDLLESAEIDELAEILEREEMNPIAIKLDEELAQYPGLPMKKPDGTVELRPLHSSER